MLMAVIGRIKLGAASGQGEPGKAQAPPAERQPQGTVKSGTGVPAGPYRTPACAGQELRNGKLLEAAAKGDVVSVSELLGQHAEASARDADGNTPLMLASMNGHADTVRALLMAGADPNAQNYKGDTAMYWQAKDGCLELADGEIARMLRAFGAD